MLLLSHYECVEYLLLAEVSLMSYSVSGRLDDVCISNVSYGEVWTTQIVLRYYHHSHTQKKTTKRICKACVLMYWLRFHLLFFCHCLAFGASSVVSHPCAAYYCRYFPIENGIKTISLRTSLNYYYVRLSLQSVTYYYVDNEVFANAERHYMMC